MLHIIFDIIVFASMVGNLQPSINSANRHALKYTYR